MVSSSISSNEEFDLVLPFFSNFVIKIRKSKEIELAIASVGERERERKSNRAFGGNHTDDDVIRIKFR